MEILEVVSYLGAMALVVAVAWSIVVMLIGPGILTRLNERCTSYSAACGIDIGILIPLLLAAAASAIFFFSRLRLVMMMRTMPQQLGETVTADIGGIVGRDELCRVIIEDIRQPGTRRPHLLVGGRGSGKTTVLVRLNMLLAGCRANPVLILLRDATDGLNFQEMAHTQFLPLAELIMRSGDNAEKVWKQLSKDDKIVVIADGLEGALTEGGASVHEDRDNLIRTAIHFAREFRLPLIISSRPHDSLRGADATIMELEPLSEEAALEYIDPRQSSAGWLGWIVETAGLTELPEYLQITRQLFRTGWLDYLSTDRSERENMRSLDRSRLRVYLLDTWMKALCDGYLMPAVPLNRSEREATVEWLSALACISLLGDTIDVRYEDYYEGEPPSQQEGSQQPKYPEIDGKIQSFVDEKLPRRHLDIRLAVTWGDRLSLVKAHGEGLRFPHGVMQAYLASRFMGTALQDSKFRQDAAARLRSPGREFLIALVLYARSADTDRERRRAERPFAASSTLALCSDVRSIRDVLITSAAHAKDDVRQLDLYAAALEIDSFLDESRHRDIARSVANGWEDIRGWDQRTVDEAKLGLVSRFGEAARTVADRRDRGLRTLNPAYEQLFEMARCELSHHIRLAIAQEIGAGGDEAFRLLRQPSRNAPGNIWKNAAWPDATAHAKGRSANAHKNHALRGRTLCAWLTPLLAGSVDECRDEARQELGLWLDRVGRDQGDGGNYFHLSLEVALAQGFKYAANRRVRHPYALPATRDYLAEQALEMLRRARFWFTQLTLIQALCLWEMPDRRVLWDDKTGRRGDGNDASGSQARQRGSNPEATVGHWLVAARNGRHPFVAEAGKLAVQALKTGHPERFLWIDESGIVSSVGSSAAQVAKDWKHRLWIPPSAGWTALDPRALQLVADVLLLLNLAERGEGPHGIEQRLRRVSDDDLPLCFTRNRDPLDPATTVGGLFKAPGRNCIDGCEHNLCPYPPYRVQPYRSELSGAFCRGQQTLLSNGLSAPWQTIPRANLKHFWEQMAGRAHGVSTDHDLD